MNNCRIRYAASQNANRVHEDGNFFRLPLCHFGRVKQRKPAGLHRQHAIKSRTTQHITPSYIHADARVSGINLVVVKNASLPLSIPRRKKNHC
jgi:hypothetical protein